MADQYRLKNNLERINNQLEAALKIDGDTLQSKSEALAEVINNLRYFFYNMGKPTMNLRLAGEHCPPYSEDFNETFREINTDLNTIFMDIIALEKTIVTDFNYGQIERKLLQSKLQHVEDLLKDYILYSDVSEKKCIVIKDSFNDCSKIDNKSTRVSSAHVNTAAGVVTLGHSGTINRTLNSKITIEKGDPLPTGDKKIQKITLGDIKEAQETLENILTNKVSGKFNNDWNFFGKNSNGFCGNLHEVVPAIGTEEKFVAVSENNTHADFVACIDDNPDTWFEYELCNFPEEYKKDPCRWYGLSFAIDSKREIRWDRDPINGQLRLCVKLILDEPEIINSIVISPYVPPNMGARRFEIEDIRISEDGSSNGVSIFDGIDYNKDIKFIDDADSNTSDYVYNFPQRLAKTVDIQFVQSTKYNTNIGHIYYERVTEKQIETKRFFGLYKKTDNVIDKLRVDGPNIPLHATGAIISDTGAIGSAVSSAFATAGAITYGVGGAAAAIGIAGAAAALPIVGAIAAGLVGLGAIISGLVGGQQTEVLSDKINGPLLEAFPGHRYCIGIRDIKILSTRYKEESEIVSMPFELNNPIYKVSLQVNEEVPKIFNEYYPDSANQWLKYYFSLDDGLTWHRISPQGYPEIYDENNQLIPEIYTINSQELKETRNNNVGFIETELPAYSIRFKAHLSRPVDIDDADSYTPSLHDYKLMVFTEEALL